MECINHGPTFCLWRGRGRALDRESGPRGYTRQPDLVSGGLVTLTAVGGGGGTLWVVSKVLQAESVL